MAYLSNSKRQKRRNRSRNRFVPDPNGKPGRTRSGGGR